jgi:hypothetical protein
LPAPPRPPADAPVGINAVAATKAVAAKQQITDLGDMALLLMTRRSAAPYFAALSLRFIPSHRHQMTLVAARNSGALIGARCIGTATLY